MYCEGFTCITPLDQALKAKAEMINIVGLQYQKHVGLYLHIPKLSTSYTTVDYSLIELS